MGTINRRYRDPSTGRWVTLPAGDKPPRGADTAWLARVRLKGHPAQTATFDRKADAEEWMQATETALKEGRHFPGRAARRRTLADLIDRYIADVLPAKRDARTRGQQLAWWRAEIGHRTLAEAGPDVLAETRDKLAREPKANGEPRSPATVNRYLAALSHVFTTAVREWRWADHNPLAKVSKRKEPRGRIRFLDDRERERLLAACDEGPPYLRPIVLLALATGMRRGEILGLRWRDVDLGGSGARGRVTLLETKNGEVRGVPIVGQALETLREWAKVRRLADDRVFPDTSSFHHRFNAAVRRAGIDDLRFHDLRHTAASYLAMNGASPSEIAGVLGHKTLAMVKRYAHLSDAHLGNVLERMNARFLDGGSS